MTTSVPDSSATPPCDAPLGNQDLDALKPCDIVMEGGITSGIVYPTLARKLAERCRFRSIGGTSVGAIAAAVTAAAEYRRVTTNGTDTSAFETLCAIPAELGAPADVGPTTLFALFQPQRRTWFFYRLALLAMALKRKPRPSLSPARGSAGADAQQAAIAHRRFIHRVQILIAGIGLPAAAAVIVSLLTGTSYGHAALVVLRWGVVLIGVLAIVGALLLLAVQRVLTGNHFGACTGGADDPDRVLRSKKLPPLAYWLAAKIDTMAGRAPAGSRGGSSTPLTFGDLWYAGRTREGDEKPADPAIELEMMTTCISHTQPYRVGDLKRDFFFDAAEFGRYFPPTVVQWMICCSEKRKADEGDRDERFEQLRAWARERGIYVMPEIADLPIVVGARLSMSFPILLSAVPLYAPDYAHIKEAQDPATTDVARLLRRCWFSDGGLTSNFPIHFFDNTLPSRPTFGVVLEPRRFEDEPNPSMAAGNNENLRASWTSVSGRSLVSFAGRLINTMRLWNDAAQMRAPGYRDRIVHILLRPEEGGLNLMMTEDQINAMAGYGRAAGEMLLDWYCGAKANARGTGWTNHRWVRYRVAMAGLHETLERLHSTWHNPGADNLPYPALLQRLNSDLPSYHWKRAPAIHPGDTDDHARLRSIDHTTALLSFIGTWIGGSPTFGQGSPRPRPEMRIRPHV